MPYDPSVEQDPRNWLALDDEERLSEALAYHKRSKIKPPNSQLHAIMHVAVENQVAEGYEAAVRALGRLLDEGLERHEAIHAIASRLATQMHGLMGGAASEFDRAAYDRDLNALTADAWTKNVG